MQRPAEWKTRTMAPARGGQALPLSPFDEMHNESVPEGVRSWPKSLIAIGGTWLVLVVALAVWAGPTATGSHKWIAGVTTAAVTFAVGWMLARRRKQARILALGGGIVLGGANALSVLANPGADPLPWGLAVVANVVVGLVVVPVIIALGAGARLAFDRVTLSGRST